MKLIASIVALGFVLGMQSCQSEYSERMAQAVQLKKKHTEIQNILTESNSNFLKEELMDIEREINLQATISGNEELFLKELWSR